MTTWTVNSILATRKATLTSWVLGCLLICVIPILAQEPRDEYALKWVQLPDLSADRNIYDVCKDRLGVLWIGCKTGLFHYNGISAEPFRAFSARSFSDKTIKAIQEDEEGNLWLATASGLKILSPDRSSLLSLSHFNLPAFVEKSNRVHLCKGPDNSLFIAVGKHVFQYQSRKITRKYLLPFEDDFDPFILKYSHADGFLFICDNGPEVKNNQHAVITSEGLIQVNPPIRGFVNNSSRDVINPRFLNFIVDVDRVHFGYRFLSRHEIKYDQGRHLFMEYGPGVTVNKHALPMTRIGLYEKIILSTWPFSKSGFSIVQVFRLNNGVDVCTSSEGLFVFQLKSKLFRQIQPSIGKRIRGIHQDRFGHLIYSTYDDLLWQYPQENQAHLLKKNWLAWAIHPLDAGNSRFFLGAQKDINTSLIAHSTNQKVTLHASSPAVDTNRTGYCIAVDKLRGGFWSYQIAPKYLQLFFYQQSNGKQYFLNRIDHFSAPRGMVLSKGLWLGGSDGLKRFIILNPESGRWQEESLQIPEKLKHLPILTLYCATDGTIWIGADGQGLFRFQPDSGKYKQFTAEDGLADNSIFSILGEPGDSVLCVGTGKGLSRFYTKQSRFENYFEEDGLTNNEFNTGSTYRAADGTLYMGGQDGITYFHPKDFRFPKTQLRQTAQITLQGKIGSKYNPLFFLDHGSMLQIRPNIQLIQIRFQTDDYLHAERQRFRYRIPGLIDQWQILSSNDKALMTYLPAGKHTLEIQTQSYRGVWLPPYHYALKIFPPWYKTWWFRTLLVLVMFLTLYVLYHLHIRELQREFSLRQQISNDLHDSLGSRMFLLRSLSQQITNPLLPDADKQSQLNKLEAISQDSFKAIRDFIWAFDPKQDQVAQLFERMDDFAENYLSPLIEALSIDHAPVSEHLKISPRKKYHLLNVYQELLTNMVKHTMSQVIHIQLKAADKQLSIYIQNQHRGYRNTPSSSIAVVAESYGLESIQQRLQDIKARIEWKEPNANEQMVTLIVLL